MDLFENFINMTIDGLNTLMKQNKMLDVKLGDSDDSKKTFILFIIVFIVYMIYTIRNNVIPGIMIASAIAGVFYFNKLKVTKFLKKYNLDKISTVDKWINL